MRVLLLLTLLLLLLILDAAATVGRNCVIELDFAIDRDGLVNPVHEARYRSFGSWISSC